jgi:spermidine synthase
MAGQRWIAETLYDDLGFRLTYRVAKVLYETRTRHQHLVLFENPFFGKVLMLDGATQFATREEFIYHEMMSHVPLFAHGAARDVLIVGGGDCAIAEEVLKHEAVRHVTLVEIDSAIIEFAKRHFPQFTKSTFADARFESVIEDGMKYVATTQRKFDIIIVDSTDPIGPSKVLFTQKFYRACKRCLKEGGVLVTQNGAPILRPRVLIDTMRKFRQLFADASCYVAAIPTYVGGHLAIGWATEDRSLRRLPVRTIAARYRKTGNFLTKYWTPEVHVAAFALPRFIADTVADAKLAARPRAPPVVTDGHQNSTPASTVP